MGFYRKKPVVIEAFQMTKERRLDNSEWPEWLNEAWNKDVSEPNSVFPEIVGISNGKIQIRTLEGIHTVSWGDYIIQGVNKELYLCKPDIFEKTYEEVQ